jgi:DNA replication protein DnaC
MEVAVKYARQLASLQTSWKLLLIHGEWGNGKTHILEAVCLELRRKGIFCRVQTFPDFMGYLKQTFDRERSEMVQTFNGIIQGVSRCQYLLIDDVGAADSFTPFAVSQLERIVLTRYRENLFTVLTTNKKLAALPEFIVSRFSDAEKARIAHNTADDYRLKKGGKDGH